MTDTAKPETTPTDWTWTPLPANYGPNPGPVFEALAKVMAELPGIEKSERNTQQNFDFRGIDSITAQTRKLFGKHGLAIIPKVRSSDFENVTSAKGSHGYRCVVHVDYTIGHSSGGTIEASMQGEAVDYGDKSTSKAVQMAFKYLLTELLHIGSGGDDPDAHSPDIAGQTVLTEAEIAERATNKLKADVIALVGDKAKAKALYSDAVSNHGFGFDDPIPADLHSEILSFVEGSMAEDVKDSEAPFEVPA